MPVTLRRRLDCHYCGRRSKLPAGEKPGRKFQCEHCLAVNFFDENGEIADVPLEEAAPAQRFAQPVAANPLPDDNFSSQDSVFCSTCLKNQQLYTYNLSQFLPDPEHPEYDKVEAQLPEYKKGLEQRYPQCCAKCEPKVRAQLHKATYNARSDHLRRVLERSRQRRVASRWGWRSLLLNAAGLGYTVSLALQVLWHLYGSQVVGGSPNQKSRPFECFSQWHYVPECFEMMEPLVGLSLVLGLLCIWWNPKWQHKLSNSERQLSGLNEYYLAQFLLLGLRFSAWIILLHSPLSLRTAAMLHACFAVAITVLAGWSIFGITTITSGPQINWHDDPAPLLSSSQFVPPPPFEQQEIQQPPNQPFNIENLATPGRPAYQSWNPPTPPPDGAEAMDWTPSQPTFQPELKQIRYTAADPTPFHGTLPALNTKGVLKNQNQGRTDREAIGLPPGFFDKSQKSLFPARQIGTASEAIVQPKFFGHERQVDTGLESIFDTVFSLQDSSLHRAEPRPTSDAKPFRAAPAKEPSRRQPSEHGTLPALKLFSCVSIFSLIVALAAWIFEAAIRSKTSQFGYYTVLLSVVVPFGHIIIILSSRRIPGQTSNILLYTFEASLLIGVAMVQDQFGELFRDLWDKLAIAVVALLLPQEFLALTRYHWASQHRTQTGLHKYVGPESFPEPLTQSTNLHLSNAAAPMPQLTRTSSSESIESQQSIPTTIDTGPWETPRADNYRFEYFDSSKSPSLSTSTRSSVSRNRQPQIQNRNMTDMDGLSLNRDSGVPQPKQSTGITDTLSRMGLGSSSGSNIAGPRTRRKF
ncbi:uncharacterized protein Z520_08991 [Fonsecaea multimorphosa CBS 102226]|uniref:Ima1 N-terminal domain-containing protein n=1 Tax=Fonsecaea multimorphosa CBS 102226 TaxID=1442371 RepID=A0A0D2JY63_9EURO|nr:uncharacterized protein Z520_08991 [Fonsecaea multimorphosa CBS 102226]KIX95474.1 hypothetical protein Z520_08991 [Fonsecaea multimorphosa CBS 102226]OAL21005.1 hypothetical protein AYO22_08425 [Fonsecaea multimorphosa]